MCRGRERHKTEETHERFQRALLPPRLEYLLRIVFLTAPSVQPLPPSRTKGQEISPLPGRRDHREVSVSGTNAATKSDARHNMCHRLKGRRYAEGMPIYLSITCARGRTRYRRVNSAIEKPPPLALPFPPPPPPVPPLLLRPPADCTCTEGRDNGMTTRGRTAVGRTRVLLTFFRFRAALDFALRPRPSAW